MDGIEATRRITAVEDSPRVLVLTTFDLDEHVYAAVAVEALLRHERLPHQLWDPCCGPGNIVKVLRAAGHEVIGSDLVDYGDPTHFYRRDFLMERKAPDGCEGVVMNAPFKLAAEFIAHALDLSPLVIALARLAFMESERRTPILEGRGLARIHVFRRRLP